MCFFLLIQYSNHPSNNYTLNVLFLPQHHGEIMPGISFPAHTVSLRQKVLFCIIPIIILDGSWVAFIKPHAWGRGLIASINLIQPLVDVVVDGQARPDGEDLALWSSILTDSDSQSATLMAGICGDWQQVFQMLGLIVWLELSNMVIWLDYFPDMWYCYWSTDLVRVHLCSQ